MSNNSKTGICCGCKNEFEVAAGNKNCCNPVRNSQCCSTGQDCLRTVNIDFLYLDLSECTRCLETETNLEEAINDVAQVLAATGVQVKVQKTKVESEKQALELGFISSPTIRINGRDIQMDLKESPCESCGDLCGDEVDCRVWVYQGKEYTAPPKGMIIEAILREAYGRIPEGSPEPLPLATLPDNLKKFFRAKAKKESNSCSCS
ncbi:MAG: DUF2703 domain-containing protein [Clostridia bacterium]|nr:DUF2703 domain-containing protein [Clostridia bacterium]